MYRVIQEIMHQVALLPVLTMLVLLKTSRFGPRQWLLANALAVSWIMDSINFAFLDRGAVALILEYGTPLQLALVLGVVVKDRTTLAYLLAGLIVAVLASMAQGFEAREIVVPVLGGFVVALYAWRSEKGFTRSGLVVYFGLGALAWIVWSLDANNPARTSLATWYLYQSTRLIGTLLVTAAFVMHARKPRLELV